jgi:hypothetical protein
MHLLVCIDDTDDLDSMGTGEVAELLAAGIVEHGWGAVGRVTRHQLLIHPDIAYTSHNSSMCFEAEIAPEALTELTRWAGEFLADHSVEAADPGLAIVGLESLRDPGALMAYGRAAKEKVFAKEDAYALAAQLGVHLSEHGGTGLGVIGALAGAGLKLTGSDGRFKGKFRLVGVDGVATVAAIKHQDVDSVRTLEGVVLGDDESVLVSDECKLVLLDGCAALMVKPSEAGAAAPWIVVDRKALRSF